MSKLTQRKKNIKAAPSDLPETEAWTDPDGSRTISVGDLVRKPGGRESFSVLKLRREPISGWCVVVKDGYSGGLRTFPVSDVKVDRRRKA
jgi:hypothetical protein